MTLLNILSALKENERYLSSIQGRIDLFNNSLQTMWMNFIDSDAVKGVVDAGTTLMKFLDTAHGKIIAVSAVLAGLAKFKLKVNFTDMFGKLTGQDDMAVALQKIQSISETGASAIDKYAAAIKNLSTTQQAQVLASKGLAESEQLAILTRSLGSEAAAKQAIAEAALATAQQSATGETLIRTIATKTQNQEFAKSFVATTGITGATGALTEEQIKAAIAALQQARATGKLSDEQYEAIVSTIGLDKATEGLNKNVGGLGQKLKDVLSSNKASIIAAGVAIIAFAIDKLTTNLHEASEAATDAFDKIQSVVDSTTSNISSLESELSTIKDQIQELSGNELSFAEQENLNYLKTQEESLRRQLDTQNSILAAQEASRNKQAIAAVKAYTKASTEGAEETIDGWKTAGSIIGGIVALGGWAASILIPGDFGTIGLAASALASKLGTGMIVAGAGAYAGGVAGENIGSGVANGGVNNYEEWYKTYTDAIDAARKDEQKALEEYKKDTSNTDKLDKWQEAQQRTVEIETEMYDHLSKMESMMSQIDYGEGYDEALDEWYNFVDKISIENGSQGAVKNALDRLFGEDASEVVKAYRNKIKNDIENGEAVDFQEMIDVTGLGDDLDALGLKTQDVEDYFTKLGEAGADAIEKIDVSDLVSELAKIEGALESVQSVLEEFRTEGIVSAGTLSGMQEEFGNLGEAWENYVNTMLSGTATMADAKAATENLAKEYLEQNINNLKDNRLEYIAQLENFGIENAKDLVDSYINNSFWNSTDFANFKGNAQELIDLAKEYGVTIEDISEADELLIAKENARLLESQRATQVAEHNAAIYNRDVGDQKKADEYHNALGLGESGESWWTLHDALSKTGQYASMAEDELQEVIDYNFLIVSNYLKSLPQYMSTDFTLEDLFPSLTKEYIIPGIKVSQEEVDKAEKEYQEKLDKMNLTVTPRLDMNPADTIEEISEIESGFEGLSSAYNEFLEEGIVSAGTLAGLKDTFDVVGMKDEYSKFVTVLGNSNSTIEEVKASLLDLANAYLNTLDITDQMDESEKEMIIEQLTRLGITNAQEWLDTRINAYKDILDAYNVDLNNFNTLEEAKAAIVANEASNQVDIQADLVEKLSTKYGIDLSQFVNMEDGKVEAAKEAAKKIAEAHFAAASAAAYNEEVSTLDVVNNTDDARKEQMLAKKYQSGQLHSTVLAEYDDVMKIIDAIGSVDVGDKLDAFFGDDANIDFDKFEDLGDSNSTTELDWLDHYFTKIENEIKDGEARLENAISADTVGLDEKNTIIDEIIGLYESKKSLLDTAKNAYQNRADALLDGFSDDIKAKIKNGSINIEEYDGELAEDIQNYFDYITKANDLEIELGGVTVTIADFSLQKFDNVATAFDNEIEEKFQSDQDLIEAEIGYLEEQGKRVSPELYQKLIDIQNEEQKVLENKKKTLEDVLATEMAAGRIQVGDKQWYEMTNAINEVDEAIIQGKQDLESFQNSINDLYWDNFDKLVDRLDAVNSELSHLFDLLSEDDKVVDEFGNWTDEGIASLGLLAQQMENAQSKAEEYKQAMDDLESNKANYSLDEYNEKMAELKDSYLSEIKNIEDLKDEMVNLNKVRIEAIKKGIDKEIEALEKKNKKIKESLDLEKEQYEWQKQVAEKEKSIADIQRRLNALAGDNSASAIAERRKLQAELAQAQAEMDDMWYEHGIEEQQKSLDESLDNYKENKEDEKEALDKWLEDEEKVIQESFDLFNSNVDLVSSVLTAFEQEHGIKLTEAITDPWKSGIDAMTAYRNELAKMKQEQEDAKDDADETADDIIESLNEPDVTPPSVPNPPSSDNSQTEETENTTPSHRTYTIKKNDTLSGIAKSELGSAARWQEIYNLNKDVISNPNLIYPGQKIKLPYYAKGTTGVKDDQWAITDELGDELTLHAGPNGRLQYLTKGSGVVTADLTQRLMEWGELDPSQVLENSSPKIGAPHITTNNFDIDLSFGSLVHVDHCDQNTLPDLQKMVRGEFDNMMKTVNQKLKRK